MTIVHILATGFGAGYCPRIPGTAGTLVGVALAAACTALPLPSFIFLVVGFGVLAVWVADLAQARFQTKDPQCIVIDEIAGYLIAVAMHPWSWRLALAAFLLFRLFDVVKPPPCRAVERWRGGLGIVADDLVAGLYVNLVLWIVNRWIAL